MPHTRIVVLALVVLGGSADAGPRVPARMRKGMRTVERLAGQLAGETALPSWVRTHLDRISSTAVSEWRAIPSRRRVLTHGEYGGTHFIVGPPTPGVGYGRGLAVSGYDNEDALSVDVSAGPVTKQRTILGRRWVLDADHAVRVSAGTVSEPFLLVHGHLMGNPIQKRLAERIDHFSLFERTVVDGARRRLGHSFHRSDSVAPGSWIRASEVEGETTYALHTADGQERPLDRAAYQEIVKTEAARAAAADTEAAERLVTPEQAATPPVRIIIQ